MKDLLEFVVSQLVLKPKKVEISQSEEGEVTNLVIKVEPQDVGRIIGREGKIISALRHLVRARGMKEGKKVRVEVAPIRNLP